MNPIKCNFTIHGNLQEFEIRKHKSHQMFLLNADTLVDATKSLKYEETSIFNKILKTGHQEEVIHKHLCSWNIKEKANQWPWQAILTWFKNVCALLIFLFTITLSTSIASSTSQHFLAHYVEASNNLSKQMLQKKS